MGVPRCIEWVGGVDGYVRLIDQTLLPTELAYRAIHSGELADQAL